MKSFNRNTKLLAVIICVVTALSCTKDFLNKEPFDKLVPASFFSTEAELKLYANSFYEKAVPTGLSVAIADEMGDYTSKSNSPAFIAGSFSAVDQAAWSWSDLRNINYFLQKMHNPAIAQEARDHYEGLARFFRAYFYFDKVKTYGDVPWYSTPLDVSDIDELYKGRDPRTLVMDSVLKDLDFACTHIRDAKDNSASTVTRLVALAYKSRVCLFEGTFRKYHTELGLTASAAEWLKQAAEAAKLVIDGKQYSIYNTATPRADYRKLFTTEAPVSQEVLWAVVYNNALRKWHDITWKFSSATYGARWGLNKQFINTYLNTDGSRFTDKEGFDTIQFVREMNGRDARLAQTIRALGYKRSDGTAAPPNFGYTFTGYHIYKYSLDDKYYDGTAEAFNAIPLIRYAEVLLNYAEAKAELGEMNNDLWNTTIAALRKRAGTGTQPPATADKYLQQVYFPEISDPFLLEIRRERGIELVYEGFRYADLLRWKKGHLLEMQWKGIYVPAMDQPMDLDGNGTPDVSFVKTIPATKVPGVVYYVIDGSAARLTEGTKGFVTWRDDEKRSFPDKKYFRPIANADYVLNPKLGQNKGWE
ncbi:RagB/SusD family nutrient uptake outer membrane protein [Filimonas effusa]|uniref:RagB/SusD family nutrient uptake outer membrane protein n=1 Tax=Filimonas effusa TaxID=2508721 RepID=A0A4Q1D109_9BACT|nr:RagB/SusD family nutrient uptake outer membrane protein [Filimonas effusa]RXK81456.1 RagB/SusD family nutrient uptake outer membrane protein [Filimonas effusa]